MVYTCSFCPGGPPQHFLQTASMWSTLHPPILGDSYFSASSHFLSDACKSEGDLYRWFIHVVFAQAALPNTSFKLPQRGPPFIHPYLETLTFLLQATSCPFNFTTTFSNSLDIFLLFSRIICAFASFNFSPFSFYTLCNSCKIYTWIVWH